MTPRRRLPHAALLLVLVAPATCDDGAAGAGDPDRGPSRPATVTATHGDTLGGAALAAVLGCGACHPGAPGPVGGRDAGRPLDGLDARWQPGDLIDYLVDPTPLRPERVARMPDFGLDRTEAAAVVLHLLQAGDPPADRRALRALARAHPRATADRGAAIVGALGCAGCHRGTGTEPRAAAPPVAGIRERLRPQWLRAYLAAPVAVRPFGYHPGSGSRMPDFALSPAEADSLTAWLAGDTTALAADGEAAAASLSPFRVRKAEALLRGSLPCLGCHALEGVGGRIGPALDHAAARLRPAYLRRVIEAPDEVVPGTIMPASMEPEATMALVAEYLLGRRPSATAAAGLGLPQRGYPSLIEHAPVRPPPDGSPDAAGLYARYCAACHGVAGGGDGFNARHLPVTPTAHADAAHMATRADATLFDGIHGGGHILGRSHRMPAFGASLSRAEIRALVAHLRALCACQQPAWAAGPDGAPGTAP